MKIDFLTGLIAGVLICAGLGAVSPLRGDDSKPPGGSSAAVKHTDAKGAAQLVTKAEVVVLDVRTPGEFSSGHIPGATNIDFRSDDFAKKLGELDKGKCYLIHCASGGRSTAALPQLSKAGLTNVVHLDGGFKAWQAAGNTVQKP